MKWSVRLVILISVCLLSVVLIVHGTIRNVTIDNLLMKLEAELASDDDNTRGATPSVTTKITGDNNTSVVVNGSSIISENTISEAKYEAPHNKPEQTVSSYERFQTIGRTEFWTGIIGLISALLG